MFQPQQQRKPHSMIQNVTSPNETQAKEKFVIIVFKKS